MNNTQETKPENFEENRGKNKGIENLQPFKPGESGNPNGRPKGQRNYATIYREALIKLAKANNKTAEELEEEILSKAIVSARGGDYRFYKDILDRLHGTAIQKSDITSDGKQLPIPIINVPRHDTEDEKTDF